MTVGPCLSSIPPVYSYQLCRHNALTAVGIGFAPAPWISPKERNMSELAVSSDVAIVKPRNVPTITQPDTRLLLRVRSAGLTDPGNVRAGNEDQFWIAQWRKAL